MTAKEMKYGPNRITELLDTGKCFGYTYYIMNLGTHPTSYVEIPSNHKLYRKNYHNIDIEVHGGLTYSDDTLYIGENKKIQNSWFIGWDYAHWGDYTGYSEVMTSMYDKTDKKWTTKEIQQDVFNVCKQVSELGWLDE